MVGNIFPLDAIPFEGCFQESWPLQLEMQLFILISIIVKCFKRYPQSTVLLVALLICLNFVILFRYYHSHGLSVAYVNMHNYRYGLNSVMKPWNHFGPLSSGFLLALLHQYLTAPKDS